MESFNSDTLLKLLSERPVQYKEFLKVPAMSCGIYQLDAGVTDPQQPHDQDEIYYVLNGKAKLESGGTVESIGPGSVLYVPAAEQHRFTDIETTLTLLVVFAPAEISTD